MIKEIRYKDLVEPEAGFTLQTVTGNEYSLQHDTHDSYEIRVGIAIPKVIGQLMRMANKLTDFNLLYEELESKYPKACEDGDIRYDLQLLGEEYIMCITISKGIMHSLMFHYISDYSSVLYKYLNRSYLK